MYEEREAELDRQDSLDALEEERDVAKARSAFYQQQARRYQSREVRAKNYNVGELVLRLPEKKKDKLKPKWEGPFIIDQVLTGGAYRLRDASDNRLEPNPWNAADSEDSTPSAGLRVRLLPLSIFIHYLSFISLLLPLFSLTAFKGQFVPCLHTTDALSALIIPGGFFHRSLFIYTGFMPSTCVILPHVPLIHHYMHRYHLSFGQAGLPGSCIYALRSR